MQIMSAREEYENMLKIIMYKCDTLWYPRFTYSENRNFSTYKTILEKCNTENNLLKNPLFIQEMLQTDGVTLQFVPYSERYYERCKLALERGVRFDTITGDCKKTHTRNVWYHVPDEMKPYLKEFNPDYY